MSWGASHRKFQMVKEVHKYNRSIQHRWCQCTSGIRRSNMIRRIFIRTSAGICVLITPEVSPKLHASQAKVTRFRDYQYAHLIDWHNQASVPDVGTLQIIEINSLYRYISPLVRKSFTRKQKTKENQLRSSINSHPVVKLVKPTGQVDQIRM